jgi:hypothetical protein
VLWGKQIFINKIHFVQLKALGLLRLDLHPVLFLFYLTVVG